MNESEKDILIKAWRSEANRYFEAGFSRLQNVQILEFCEKVFNGAYEAGEKASQDYMSNGLKRWLEGGNDEDAKKSYFKALKRYRVSPHVLTQHEKVAVASALVGFLFITSDGVSLLDLYSGIAKKLEVLEDFEKAILEGGKEARRALLEGDHN